MNKRRVAGFNLNRRYISEQWLILINDSGMMKECVQCCSGGQTYRVSMSSSYWFIVEERCLSLSLTSQLKWNLSMPETMEMAVARCVCVYVCVCERERERCSTTSILFFLGCCLWPVGTWCWWDCRRNIERRKSSSLRRQIGKVNTHTYINIPSCFNNISMFYFQYQKPLYTHPQTTKITPDWALLIAINGKSMRLTTQPLHIMHSTCNQVYVCFNITSNMKAWLPLSMCVQVFGPEEVWQCSSWWLWARFWATFIDHIRHGEHTRCHTFS